MNAPFMPNLSWQPAKPPGPEWRPHQIEGTDALDAHDGRFALAEVTVAGGKSYMLARLAQKAQERGERALILAHNNLLVSHNLQACRDLGLAPQPCSAKIGVNVFGGVTVGTIQTVANRLRFFRDVKRVLIDEVHLVPPDEDTQYRKLFDAIPDSKVSGLTGSPFRAGSGSLEGTFGPIIFRYGFGEALRDGYVKPLRLIEASAESISTKGVKVNAKGEWSDSELSHRGVALAPEHVPAMINAMNMEERTRILVFACDIEHADCLAQLLREHGESALSVHSKSKNEDTAVAAFRAGSLRWLVSVAKFTTGFDVPDIDGLVLTRPIRSLVYYVQGLGRGARLTPMAPDCVVVDLGGNANRHGALDMLRIPEKKVTEDGEERGELGPMRTCKACLEEYARFFGPVCPHCDFDHRSLRVVGSDLRVTGAKDRDLIADVKAQPKWVAITGAPMKAIHRQGWTIQTEGGKAKWWPNFMPRDIVQAFVRWDSKHGLLVDGLADARGELHPAR